MAAELATGYVTLLPSARGFRSALDKEIGRDLVGAGEKAGAATSKAFGSKFVTGLKVVAGAALGIFAGVKVLGGFISEAEEAEKVTKLTAAVLKSTGGVANVTAKHVENLASALSKKSGVDDEVIASGQNVLLTFTRIANQSGKGNKIFDRATTIALDMSKALGTDLQSSVIQVGKALNDPIKGVTALQRVGVSFTQQQKDQIKKLVESGQTLKAQKLILGELKTEFGGAAAAGATSSEKLSVAWGNFQEQIGTFLLPLFDKIVSWLTDALPKGIKMGETLVARLAKAFEQYVLPVLKVFVEVGKTAFDWMKDNIPTVATFVSVLSGLLIINAITKAVIAFNIALAVNPIVLIAVAVAALAAGLVYAYTRFEAFRKIVDTTGRVIKTAIKIHFLPLILTIKAIVIAVRFTVNFVRTWWPKIAAVAKSVFGTVQKIISGVVAAVRIVWDNFGKYVFKVWLTAWKTIFTVVKTYINLVRTIISTVLGTIRTIVSTVLGRIREIVSTVFGRIREIVTTVFGVIRENVATAVGAVREKISEVFGKVREFVGTFRDGIRTVFDTIVTIIKTPIAAAQAVYEGVVTWFSNIARYIGGIVDSIAGAVGRIVDAIKGPINAVISAWNSLGLPSFTIGGWDIPGPGPNIPSFTTPSVSFPDIPLLHDGGMVPGRPGQDVLAWLRAGEFVTPAAAASTGAGRTVHINHYGQTVTPATVSAAFRMAELAG